MRLPAPQSLVKPRSTLVLPTALLTLLLLLWSGGAASAISVFALQSSGGVTSLDPVTGASTYVGGISGSSFVGLSHIPIPEPTTASLLALGLGLLCMAGRRSA